MGVLGHLAGVGKHARRRAIAQSRSFLNIPSRASKARFVSRRAPDEAVVLWFEAVGWRQPSLLAHLSILSHCLLGGRCARSSRRASAGARCEALIKPRLRRKTLTRAIGHGEHVLSSRQGDELGLREATL